MRSRQTSCKRGRLHRTDCAIPPADLAVALLGCTLVRIASDGRRLAGLIVETEAYLGHADQAAHSRNGHRSPRNESMYGPAGLAYVYFTYGMHHCMNVVAGEPGEPVAVLLRALEPTEGLDHMHANRAGAKSRRSPLRDRDLCSGPARLCQALGIDRALDGLDLTTDHRLWIEPRSPDRTDPGPIVNTTRIGIDSAGDWTHAPLRWYLHDSAHVSRR